ncbi:ATP-binding protein [Streptomyces sp. NPDC048424]|uniref:sensor histidine kinase n=1 Tax=Streptomyces sp. NPDC048424 TaxID=3155265 RepID=UPI00343B2F55
MSAPLAPRSIRAKIVCLLMVPAVSLMALWAFATVTAARSVSELNQYQQAGSILLRPVDALVLAVQAERSAAMRHVTAPSRERAEYQADRAKDTDAAASAVRRAVRASSLDRAAAEGHLAERADLLVARLDGLPAQRERLSGRDSGWQDTYDSYNDTIGLALAVQGAFVTMSGPALQPDGASAARTSLALARAREMIAREDALMGAAQVSGRITRELYQEFIGAGHTQRRLLTVSPDEPRPGEAAAYQKLLAGTALRDLRAFEDEMLEAGDAAKAGPVAASERWNAPARAVLQDLAQAQQHATTVAIEGVDPLSFAALGGSGVAVALGLVGVLLSLVISVRIGRGLVVELVELRNSALRLAGRELPRTIAQLHAGGAVDLDAVAPMRAHRDDEVGQVGAALVAVHRSAVRAAAERAEALHSISGVYVNLARRSQTLLHRQLALLDTMERRNEDPVELEDLFRLDHLTTRMRRHAESLIILSGAAPGRGWRQPVPLLDVVRAAAAEVEDFDRVEVTDMPEVRLPGTAVADMIHLLAELIENATAFSPPHTAVRVSAERVGSGIAVEIEDRGLGMDRDALAEANRRIQDTERVDLLDSGQLGLFVVNRLAHRLELPVTLRPSVYGGVVAVVLLPGRLAGETIEEADGPDGPKRSEQTASGLPRRESARPLPALERVVPPPAVATRAAPAPAPAPAEHAARAELPRRIRAAGPVSGQADGDDPYEPEREGARRTPEQARTTMASFRAGWTRGRAASPPATRLRENADNGDKGDKGENDTAGEGENR